MKQHVAPIRVWRWSGCCGDRDFIHVACSSGLRHRLPTGKGRFRDKNFHSAPLHTRTDFLRNAPLLPASYGPEVLGVQRAVGLNRIGCQSIREDLWRSLETVPLGGPVGRSVACPGKGYEDLRRRRDLLRLRMSPRSPRLARAKQQVVQRHQADSPSRQAPIAIQYTRGDARRIGSNTRPRLICAGPSLLRSSARCALSSCPRSVLLLSLPSRAAKERMTEPRPQST